MVEEAVEDGAGDGAVVVEDAGPLLEGLVGGHDEGTTFVALADDLEEEVGTVLVDGEIANLVQEEDVGAEVFAELAFEEAALLSSGEVVDDANGIGEENRVSLLAGGVAERGGEVGLADTDEARDRLLTSDSVQKSITDFIRSGDRRSKWFASLPASSARRW